MDEIELYITMIERVLENMASAQREGSPRRLNSIIRLELHTVSYNPLRGETWIPLPKELANKKVIINIKNKDNKCFLWCVLRALNPRDNHPERVDKELKSMENNLNMEGIDYPVILKDLNKFENQNPSVSITVFGYERKVVHPLRNSDNMDREHNIIQILIEEGGVKHYCLIKDRKVLSRLLSSQVSNYNGKHHLCLRCLNVFWSQEALKKHEEYCKKHQAVKIEMPKEGTMLKFINYDRREKVPFIVYADLECFIKPIQSCNPNPGSSYTEQYKKHKPSSFCYYIKCFDDEVYEPKLVSYTGEDAAQKFVEMFEEDIKIIANIPKKEMIFGDGEREHFEEETKCWICNKKLVDDKNYKVRDHCHFTGRYRGAAHKECNLKYKKANFTPVTFHNLSGYDSHLFIKKSRF